MPGKFRPVAVFDCVVFGATGDLTLRKLLPALYYRFRDGQMPAEITRHRRRPIRADGRGFPAIARPRRWKSTSPKADQDPETMRRFLAQLHYVSIDATAADADWSRFDAAAGPGPRAGLLPRHLARPLRPDLPRRSASKRLVTEHSRVVLEKPIGHDLASAHAIIERGRRRSSPRRRPSASTTTWARRRCRT